MSSNRREEIIMAALELAAQKGIEGVSMSMIADKVGIKKPSIYKHFGSRDEIVEAMYSFLRDKAREASNITPVDYRAMFSGKTAYEILRQVVDGYIDMNSREYMQMFYSVIYSGRCRQSVAAGIMAEETDKMINATRQLFYAMEVHNILHFNNADMSAVSFAMTVHGLMDYKNDIEGGQYQHTGSAAELLDEYIRWFCSENAVNYNGSGGMM